MTAVLLGLAAIFLSIGQYLVWFYAPVEMTMGLVQKIFYAHLPMSWWALASFLTVFVASILYLAKRDAKWDRLAGAAAEIGVLFSSLALVTGSLWARPMWNVWWTWDPRLTTTLIMWFVYMAYLLLRASDIGAERKPVVCAALGIVAFLDVPLVFISARYWRSIHPTVFASSGGGMEPEMWTAVLVCLFAWGLLWAALLRLRVGQLGQLALLRRISANMAMDDMRGTHE